MKDLQWFPSIPVSHGPSAQPAIWSSVVAAGLGLLLLARGHRILAIVVWTAAFLIVLGLNFPSLRRPILEAANWFKVGVARFMTLAVLWPFYVLVFGAIRLVLWVARVDLLGLRLRGDMPSYWQPPAPERTRARYYERLFTVEPAGQESHAVAWFIGIFVLILLLGGSSELILRSMGFGNPIVYRVDPYVGYYPAPNQDVHRYGGDIHINAFGMRSRDVTAKKLAGTFRILMLGDSTLYGGSYIDQSQMYSTRLEELLNQKPGELPNSPRHVQVLCMGVNAWGPQHELAYVQKFGLFHTDLIMVMGPPNDAYRPRYGVAELPLFVEGHRPHFAWQEFWEHLYWEYQMRSSGAIASLEPNPTGEQVLADGVAAWLGIASLAQTQTARVDFEMLPNEQEVREDKAAESTQRVLDALFPELARRRIPDAFPLALFRRNLGVAKLYHDGAHLDTAGHGIYALYLRDRVLQVTSTE